MAIASFPRIIKRKQSAVSPWLSLVEKTVEFSEGSEPQVYHFITQADYVGIFAITSDGLVPVVRQFRPCVEGFTWEFPGGTLEEGELPADAAVRELREETGFEAKTLTPLGSFYPDTGRLELGSHAFFARTGRQVHDFVPEPGVEVKLVTLPTLREMMLNMEFRHQLHWAIYGAALVHGIRLK